MSVYLSVTDSSGSPVSTTPAKVQHLILTIPNFSSEQIYIYGIFILLLLQMNQVYVLFVTIGKDSKLNTTLAPGYLLNTKFK